MNDANAFESTINIPKRIHFRMLVRCQNECSGNRRLFYNLQTPFSTHIMIHINTLFIPILLHGIYVSFLKCQFHACSDTLRLIYMFRLFARLSNFLTILNLSMNLKLWTAYALKYRDREFDFVKLSLLISIKTKSSRSVYNSAAGLVVKVLERNTPFPDRILVKILIFSHYI